MIDKKLRELVSFVVPVLNEEHNIKDTVDTIEKNVPYDRLDYEIIIVDGGSTDRTVEIADFLSELNKKIIVYSPGNIKGFGDAYKKGVSLAQGDYIILIPGDNEVAGEAVKDILDNAGKADIIIPYFVNQNIRTPVRQLISRVFVWLLNILSGIKLKYYNGTVLYRREVLKSYNIRTTGFAYQAECLINLINSGFTYIEIGTKLQERSSGKTKIFNIRNVFSVFIFLIDIIIRQSLGRLLKMKYTQQTRGSIKKALPLIELPEGINYIAAFLTFNCNLRCSYCINNYEGHILTGGNIPGIDWVRGINRLKLRHNLPVTLQGGEPTLHRDFYYILDNLRSDIEIDILTNLQFEVEEFVSRVDPRRINRDSNFHSIRASYHPEMMDIDETLYRASKLKRAGFNISLSAVGHPDNRKFIDAAKIKADKCGVLFFEKEFLGFHNGMFYGTYKYPEAIMCNIKKNVWCRSSELLIGPRGEIHRCTRNVYSGGNVMGHLLDPDFKIEYRHRYCRNYGYCNPCDVKVKTDRFLNNGHTAVDIKHIDSKS